MRKLLTLTSLIFIGSVALAQNDAVLATPLGAIIAPSSGCVLTATEPVTIRVFNSGPGTINSPFYLSYNITGPVASYAGETVPVGTSIPPNSSFLYTFTTTANLSLPGTYTMSDTVIVAGDPNAGNNTQSGYSVVLTPSSVGGTITGPASVCISGNSGFLTLGGNTGSVLGWEYSTDGGSTWINISNTSSIQSYNNLIIPTRYRAVVQNGSCPAVNSTPIIIAIDAVSNGGTISPAAATVCSGFPSPLMTSSGKVGTIIKWQYSIDNWVTPIDTAITALTLTYPSVTSNPTRFRVVVQNGSCVSANSSVSTITASPSSVAGTISGGTTVCSGTNSGSLTLSGHTGTIQWQFSATRTFGTFTVGSTTTTQTYTNLVATRYFRARLTSGACAAVFTNIDSVVVNPAAVGGTLSSADTVCDGSTSGLLTLTGHTSTVSSWEVSLNGGAYSTIANTLATYTSGSLTAGALTDNTYDYRVRVMNGSCGPALSSVIRITVNPKSVGGITAFNDTVCSGANGATINLTGNLGTIQNWQSSTDGVIWANIANTTSAQTYSNLTATTYYAAVVQNGVCPADTSTIDTIIVTTPSVGGTIASSVNVCYGNNSDTLTLSGHIGNVLGWEYSIDGGINWISIANTTTSYIYTNITLTTQFRVIVQNGTCPIAYSSAATLTIDPISVGGTLDGSTIACGGSNSGTLTLINYIGTIQNWESSIDGGFSWTPIVNNTATHNYLNIATTTQYRVIVKSGVCSNDTSSIATITVDPATVGGTVSLSDTVCQGSNSGTLTLSGFTGTVLHWESSTDGGVTWLTLANTSTTQNYVDLMVTTIYRAYVKSGVCNGDTSISAKITVDPMPVGGTISGSTTVCEGSNNGTLTLSGYTGTITNWESSIDLGATWISLANVMTTYMYNNLVDTTWYRAIITNGICGNDTSAYATINMFPKPQASFTTDTVCLGNVTMFMNTSTITSGFIQFNQWDFGDNNTSSSKNPTYKYTIADTFSVSLYTTSNAGCIDTATLNVIVDPLPLDTIIANGPLQFCQGDSIILSAATGPYDYMWSTTATTQNITVKISGNFALIITDTITGCSASNMETVKVLPAPTVYAGRDTTISLGSTINLNASGTGIVSWYWFPNIGLNGVSTPNPAANPIVTTIYELTGTDVNGCTDKDSITITVLIDFNVTISNLMTPNNDGYNDRWVVQNIENYPNTTVIVVNREGQQIFTSDSYDNSWDGTNTNGKSLPDGTYYYIVKFQDSDKLYKGAITILKEK
ncbi:MAG: gliding motility-associated C-terminal domain-containing protein [Bacteroidota bacterium]